MTVSPFPV